MKSKEEMLTARSASFELRKCHILGRWLVTARIVTISTITIFALLGIGNPVCLAIVMLLLVIQEVVHVLTNIQRGKAESAKRHHEMQNGFGRNFTDSLVDEQGLSLSFVEKTSPDISEGFIFQSKTEPGPQRTLENLIESSWWTQQLAKESAILVIFVVAIVIGVAVTVFIGLANSLHANSYEKLTRVVYAILASIMALGGVRSVVSYLGLKTRATQCHLEAVSLSKNGYTPEKVLLTLMKYQIARASGPLLLTAIWRFRRAELNRRYRTYLGELSGNEKSVVESS